MSAHRVEVVSDFLRDGWQAECSCGWVGDRRELHSHAVADAHVHEDEND